LFTDKKWAFNQTNVEHAPDDPGVYLLWEGDEVIYIGQVRNGSIRATLLRHLAGALGACTTSASHYSWEITLSPSVREAQRLAEFARKYQRAPRCQPKAA
jgi:hypothetical protein